MKTKLITNEQITTNQQTNKPTNQQTNKISKPAKRQTNPTNQQNQQNHCLDKNKTKTKTKKTLVEKKKITFSSFNSI